MDLLYENFKIIYEFETRRKILGKRYLNFFLIFEKRILTRKFQLAHSYNILQFVSGTFLANFSLATHSNHFTTNAVKKNYTTTKNHVELFVSLFNAGFLINFL